MADANTPNTPISEQAAHVAAITSGSAALQNIGAGSLGTNNVAVMGSAGTQTVTASSSTPDPTTAPSSTTIVMPTTAPTPGYKTTEFWAVAVVVVATFLNKSGVLGTYQVDPQIVYSGTGLVLAYLATRWGLKAQGSNGASTLNTLLTTLQKTQTPAT